MRRQAFGLLAACLALLTAGCGQAGSAFGGNGNDQNAPDQIVISSVNGGNGLNVVAPLPNAFLLLGATATRGSYNVTIPDALFIWSAAYQSGGNVPGNINGTARACPAISSTALPTYVPASNALYTVPGTAVGSSTPTLYSSSIGGTNQIEVRPILAVPAGSATGTVIPAAPYCLNIIATSTTTGRVGTTTVLVSN